MGAQFSLPLQQVIPGQLIASALWNGEWNNLATNFIPAGMDSYSDTDSQMQIQTNPFPGSVTSHASSLGGEIERIRYQISAIIGNTVTPYWYSAPVANLVTMFNLIIPIGAIVDYPSPTIPNSNFNFCDGTPLSRTTYAKLFAIMGTRYGAGDGSTTFNIPNFTDRMAIGAGNLYALGGTGGATTGTASHSHTVNSHTHDLQNHVHGMQNHTHSIPNHIHRLADGSTTTNTQQANESVGTQTGAGGDGVMSGYAVGGSTTRTFTSKQSTTDSSGGGTTGIPSNNLTDIPSINNTGATAPGTDTQAPVVQVLNPYLGTYKMIRII